MIRKVSFSLNASCKLFRVLVTLIQFFLVTIPPPRINALLSSSVSDLFQLDAVNLSAAF